MTGCRLLAFLAAVAAFSLVADDVLFLDESGRGATGRFRVLDHEGDALGLMVSADDKFVAAASSARIAVDSTRIIVTIDCPVPPGMTAQKDKASAWAGDGVELFVRPSLESTAYYQYSANAAGVFAARRNTAPDVMDGGWRSSAVAEAKDTANGFRVTFSVPLGEVFESPLKSGDMFGINFTRCGRTCSGPCTFPGSSGSSSIASALNSATTVSIPDVTENGAGVNFSNSPGALSERHVAPPPASASATIVAVPLVGASVHMPAPRVMPVVEFVAMTVSRASEVKLASNQSFVTRVIPSNPSAHVQSTPHSATAAARAFFISPVSISG